MDIHVKKVLDDLFADIDLNQTQKDLLFGIYITKLYSSCIEYLLSLQGKNPAFQEALLKLIGETREALSDDDKKTYDTFMEQKKQSIVAEILTVFSSNLPDDLKEKMKANVKRLAEKEKNS